MYTHFKRFILIALLSNMLFLDCHHPSPKRTEGHTQNSNKTHGQEGKNEKCNTEHKIATSSATNATSSNHKTDSTGQAQEEEEDDDIEEVYTDYAVKHLGSSLPDTNPSPDKVPVARHPLLMAGVADTPGTHKTSSAVEEQTARV